MKRDPILRLLRVYHTHDNEEQIMKTDAVQFIEQNPDCFERSLLIGHVTGSGWIVNRERTHTLLMHHKKLDKWFQPGGHCDGDPDVQAVALKEAMEETGVAVSAVRHEIFDIDNHIIPLRNEVPEHTHYDIRFLLQAEMDSEELPSNSEALAVRWIRLDEVHVFNNTRSIMRMVEKTKKLL
jgi:ADP-ribose pyrophosphatase